MKEKDVMDKMEELKDRAIDEEKLEDVAGGSLVYGSAGGSILDEIALPNSKDYKGGFTRIKIKK